MNKIWPRYFTVGKFAFRAYWIHTHTRTQTLTHTLILRRILTDCVSELENGDKKINFQIYTRVGNFCVLPFSFWLAAAATAADDVMIVVISPRGVLGLVTS